MGAWKTGREGTRGVGKSRMGEGRRGGIRGEARRRKGVGEGRGDEGGKEGGGRREGG